MTKLHPRLRDAINITIGAGALWAATMAALVAVFGFVHPEDIGPGDWMGVWRVAALAGLVSGIGFSALLLLVEGGRSLADVSVGRAAAWAALASAVFPMLAGKPDQILVFSPIGAVVGVMSVMIARNAAAATPSPSALVIPDEEPRYSDVEDGTPR